MLVMDSSTERLQGDTNHGCDLSTLQLFKIYYAYYYDYNYNYTIYIVTTTTIIITIIIITIILITMKCNRSRL